MSVRGVPGFMAADAKTLAMVWKSITQDGLHNGYDPLTVPVPWNEQVNYFFALLSIFCEKAH